MIDSCNHNASCGCSNKSRLYSKIVGGQNAKMQTWTWVVSIHVQNQFLCAGSLVSNSWILTAAHCFSFLNPFGNNVFQIDPSDITVYAGSINRHEQNEIRRVIKIFFHPKFDMHTFNNDIALLQLATPLDSTESTINQICLPSIFDENYPMMNFSLVAVGWGRISQHGPESPVLQQVVLKTIDYHDSSCYPLVYDPSRQFCAGTKDHDKDTCQGDSGGPLMMYTTSQQWVLVGVTSFGFGCAQPGYAGVYTRISSYILLINRWINMTDNSTYPSSLIYNTPYDDNDLNWQANRSYRYSLSFVLLLIVFIFNRFSLLIYFNYYDY